MALAIISSDLKVPPIFAQTQREHSLFDEMVVVHDVVDGAHDILFVEAEDAVGLLRIEQVRLPDHAAEGERKGVLRVEDLVEVERIARQEPRVTTALAITLLETALIAECAHTLISTA